MDECVLAVVLVWITLAMLPRATSKRWATGITPLWMPLSGAAILFCRINDKQVQFSFHAGIHSFLLLSCKQVSAAKDRIGVEDFAKLTVNALYCRSSCQFSDV